VESATPIGVRALVVTFRNEALEERDICSASGVEARLRFKNLGGAEINKGIDNACWLDTWNDSMDIGVEEAKHLVLIVRQSDDYTYIPFKRSGHSGDVPLRLEDVHTIEVKLIDGRYSSILGNATIPCGRSIHANP